MQQFRSVPFDSLHMAQQSHSSMHRHGFLAMGSQISVCETDRIPRMTDVGSQLTHTKLTLLWEQSKSPQQLGDIWTQPNLQVSKSLELSEPLPVCNEHMQDHLTPERS